MGTGFSENKTGTPKLAVKMTLLEPISSCYVRVKLGDALGVRGVDRKPLIIAELEGKPLLIWPKSIIEPSTSSK
jgi:hypothetical protein